MIRDIEKFDYINCYNGTGFEDYTAKWLRKLGISANTTASDDGGVDIVASIVIKEITYKFYIQCKYQNRTLGTQPVHEIYSGTALYGGDGKPVIWTNNHISTSARDKGRRLGVEFIGYAELSEINSTIISRQQGNRTGLLGIIEGIIVDNDSQVEQCAKGLTRSMRRKEKKKDEILNLFEEAEVHARQSEKLQQDSAKEMKLAMDLQKEALLINLDYG